MSNVNIKTVSTMAKSTCNAGSGGIDQVLCDAVVKSGLKKGREKINKKKVKKNLLRYWQKLS